VVLLLCVVTAGTAQGGESDWEALKGLTGCYVVVESLLPRERAAGFQEEDFKTKAELKLRMAGVRVLTQEESLLVEGRPYLYINVNTTADGTVKSTSFSVHVSLLEVVTTARTGPAVAVIWRATATGWGSVEHVLGSLDRRMDEFLNDWLKANPKEGP